ncbi:MAG: T9SS type A sorting domain-containing protein [Crocinitomicaceae bacterium]|nr:T9SS type A sorting domain-containing protein [Crocinitomicaceae bacterium]
MKRILLICLLLPIFGFSQTRTSTMDGDFFNPLIWNPLGLPTSGETIIINHNVVLNTAVYYTSGSITINAGGSLIEDAVDRTFWADGTGSVVNHGTFTTHLLALSPGASFTNDGDFINIDSLWNQGTITNTGTATLFDIWNDLTGTFTNSGNLTNADSLLNQGVLINNGSATVYDILNDQLASFTNNGMFDITNNMNNQGYVNNQAGIRIENDFSNCNTQSMDAMFINDGRFCVSNDMINCQGDTLTGSGSYYIGGFSSNFGVFDGTHFFYTSSGTVGIPGNIQPGVTLAVGSCNLTIDELQQGYSVYPNPVSSLLHLSVSDIGYELYDISGKLVKAGEVENYTINLNDLNAGTYMLKVDEGVKRIIKE